MSTATYLSPPMIAKNYGVKPAKVLAWIASGELIAIDVAERRGGRPRWRVSPESLEAFQRRRSSRPAPAVTRRRRERDIPRYV